MSAENQQQAAGSVPRMVRILRYLAGWVFVRPHRWLFWRMVWASDLQLLPRYEKYLGWRWPNPHWWALYWTVFRLCKWLHYDAWRPFCTWDRMLKFKPWYAAVIQRIGATTAGFTISGGECFHCASKAGCQYELAQDETGKTFVLGEEWTSASEDGTDYRWSGTTICPKCGYRGHYEDGSL